MYEEYFGFSKKPFSIVPDPHYFFLSAGHAEALAHLLFGINSEGGFVLLTGDVGTGKTTACRRLLETLPEGADTISNLWHLEVKTGDLCEEADNRGLRCLQGRGSFTQLRQMNQPVILTLVDEKKGAFYAALTNLRGKTANVVLGTEPRVVELEEINRIWSGEYLLLWRVPPDYRGEVKPGSRGPMVAWLKQHLALAQGRTPPAEKDSEFDQTLVREVKRFQLSAGLVPDGIVGPMTIMPLSPATDTGDPVLHGGKGAF